MRCARAAWIAVGLCLVSGVSGRGNSAETATRPANVWVKLEQAEVGVRPDPDGGLRFDGAAVPGPGRGR